MMKKMKLATKIILGFSLLIVVALALGGLAVYNMNNVAGESTKLATEYLPEVDIATNVRGAVNRVMYAMRGYGFTENDEFYKQAGKEMAALDAGLKQGFELAEKAVYLKKLGPAIKKIKNAQDNYAAAMKQTQLTIAEMSRLRGQLDKNAAKYINNSNAFLEGQNKAFKRDLAERQKKIELVAGLVSLGTKARVNNFKAQATNSATLMQEAASTFDKVKPISEELRKITRDAEDIKRIDATVSAAGAYQTAMIKFLAEFKKGSMANASLLDRYRGAMDEHAGIYVKNCDDFLTGQQSKLTTDMNERHQKITLANDILTIGNNIRIKAFKAQALRDPALMIEGQKDFAKINEKFEALRKITRLKEDLQRIDKVQAGAKGYGAAMAQFLIGWEKLERLGKQRDSLGGKMIAASITVAAAGLKQTNQIAKVAMDDLNQASVIMLTGLAVALVIGVLMAIIITLSITKPINAVIAGLSEGAAQVASAASQVSNSSQSLAQGAAEQAASLEETSSSMEEMGSMTRKNAENAGEADGLSNDAQQVVQRANEAMKELTTSMEEITRAGEETGKIIKTIDEIAFQTNLLALNAAVEAARAGEAGAGFAVVADEVRNLAMRAAEAAKNTADLIEGTIEKTKHGSELVAKTNEAFTEVASSTVKVGELVSEIAAASSEQSQGIDQVNIAMGEMDKVTQQNAANAEESAAASEELSAQAETMQGFVDDLVALVGNNTGNGKARKLIGRKQDEPPALPAPEQKHQQTVGSAARAKASTGIPLDGDSDFTDF